MANSFNFVGRIVKPKDDSFYSEKTYQSSGWFMNKVQFSIVCGNNVHTIVVNGSKWVDDSKNVVKTYSSPYPGNSLGDQIEIAWSDRLKEDAIAKVNPFKRFTLDLTEPGSDSKEKYEYITSYDYAKNLVRFLSSISGKDIYKVHGNIEYNYGTDKDTYYRNFCMTSLSRCEPGAEQYCNGNLDMFFFGGHVKDDDVERSVLDTYVKYYDRNAKANVFAPLPIAVYKNSDYNKKFDLFISAFNKSAVFYCPMRVEFINGSPVVENKISFDDLTDTQKRMVALGLSTIDEIAEQSSHKNGSISAERITETRFVKMTSANGVSDTDYTIDDLRTKPSDVRNASNANSGTQKPVFDSPKQYEEPKKETATTGIFDPVPFDI